MKWADAAAENLLSGLGRLDSGLFHDVMITVDGVEFPCHRNVLSAYSDYFLAMFTSGMKEDLTQTVKLKGMSHQVFGEILEALYHGKDIVKASNVTEIWRVASMLQIPSLQNYCVANMLRKDILSYENCLKIWQEARMTSCEHVQNKALDFINQNFSSITATEEFLACDLEDIIHIIQSDDLYVSNENEVVDAVFHWVKHDDTRRQHIVKLLSCTRLNLVSASYVLERLLTEKMIFEDPKARELVCKSLHYHMNEARRHDECSTASVWRRTSPYHNVMVVIGENPTDIFAYSFQKEKWFRLNNLPTPHNSTIVACTYDDDIFVSWNLQNMQPSVLYQYSTERNSWLLLKSMTTVRGSHVLSAVGHSLYALGGTSPQGGSLKIVERYDIKKAKWEKFGSLQEDVHSCGSVVVDSKIILIGGQWGNDKIKTVQCFDTSTKTSYLLGELPYKTMLPRAFIGQKKRIFVTTEEGGIWEIELQGETVLVHEKSQLWDCNRHYHGALLHGGTLYVVPGETQPNSLKLQDFLQIEQPGAFHEVRNLAIPNMVRCIACLRTSLPTTTLTTML